MVFHSVGILAGSDGKGENEHLNRINNLVGCLKKVKMFHRVSCAFFPMMMVDDDDDDDDDDILFLI